MLLICIFIIIILGIIIVKRPRTIIWMASYIRNKRLLLLFNSHQKSLSSHETPFNSHLTPLSYIYNNNTNTKKLIQYYFDKM